VAALAHTLAFTVPAVFVIIAMLLLITYRSLRAAMSALLTVAIALTLTIATAVALHIEFNLVTAIVPPLVITIGLSYTVHMLSAYFLAEQRIPGAGATQRAEWVMSRIATGLGLSGITTVVGFLSLLLNPLPAIRSFAVHVLRRRGDDGVHAAAAQHSRLLAAYRAGHRAHLRALG
jgi:predicted RND superfamily exporter protein